MAWISLVLIIASSILNRGVYAAEGYVDATNSLDQILEDFEKTFGLTTKNYPDLPDRLQAIWQATTSVNCHRQDVWGCFGMGLITWLNKSTYVTVPHILSVNPERKCYLSEHTTHEPTGYVLSKWFHRWSGDQPQFEELVRFNPTLHLERFRRDGSLRWQEISMGTVSAGFWKRTTTARVPLATLPSRTLSPGRKVISVCRRQSLPNEPFKIDTAASANPPKALSVDEQCRAIVSSPNVENPKDHAICVAYLTETIEAVPRTKIRPEPTNDNVFVFGEILAIGETIAVTDLDGGQGCSGGGVIDIATGKLVGVRLLGASTTKDGSNIHSHYLGRSVILLIDENARSLLKKMRGDTNPLAKA